MFKQFKINPKDFTGPVLVTGAGGCIGSWALALLADAGVPVAAMDLTEDKRRPGLLMAESELQQVTWFTGDIADTAAVNAAVGKSGAKAIIHLAALQVPFCKADPIAGAKVNVVGTVNIFEAARKAGIKRIAYASSIAAHGVFDSKTMATLYGAYKFANEQTSRVYAQDWQVPSVGLRPGVVYGIGRDQGMTSKTTVAILAAAAGKPYTIPFRGPVSWLHAGEVASAFIKAVSKERSSADVFDINGIPSTVEQSIELIRKIAPDARIEASGEALPFPMALSDQPVRSFLGDYGSISMEDGIRQTHEVFTTLLAKGMVSADKLA
ncbi:MAG TPA: NAD-dependent epimerase/dehydratase family protein [Burkholderiales bacterium]|nr:NAD-dependent epimerase/dehydratase family protein [Burkholderiales bacterium]